VCSEMVEVWVKTSQIVCYKTLLPCGGLITMNVQRAIVIFYILGNNSN